MTVSIIVAASENNVIGKDNAIPWHLPDDLKFFRKKTEGHPVIMGRKNFASIVAALGKPLPNRQNIVITRDTGFTADGCEIVYSIEEAISLASHGPTEEIFIIGGGEIYKQAMQIADCIYLTRVHAEVDGDVLFPEIDPDEWEVIEMVEHSADEKHEYAFTFLTYQRR